MSDGFEASSRRPRAYTATTKTRVVALKQTVEDFLDVLEDHLELGMQFVAFLADLVISLMQRSAGNNGPSSQSAPESAPKKADTATA